MFRFSFRTFLSLAAAATLALSATGCARKARNSEVKLLDDAALTDAAAMNPDGSMAYSADGGFTPTGAPGFGANGTDFTSSHLAADGTSRNGNTITTTATFDPATGSMLNQGNMAGVDAAMEIADLEMIHFNLDQAEIASEWTAVLDQHAQWLASNPAAYIQVEGHCDERGTEEYNVSLGQRRADQVREYLVSKGVDPARITTISYGKLRPLSFDESEESHALNRRAMFLVYQADDMTTASANAY